MLCLLTFFLLGYTSGWVLDTSGSRDYYIQFGRADTGNQGVIQDTGEDSDLRIKKALLDIDS